MNKFILIFTLATALVACSPKNETTYPQVYSHRGCWLKDLIPENSLAGVQMAGRFGYPAIEMDAKYTSDSILVVMHDKTINRTMRNAADYSMIEEPVIVSKTSFEELRTEYVFASDDPVQRVRIPTLEEMLECCRDNNIHPVLHSNIEESYDMAKAIVGDNFTAFTSDYGKLVYARSIADCSILWDPLRAEAEETCARLEGLGGKCGMSTMKWDMLDAEYITAIRNAGYDVQSSIFPTPHEADAIHDGANIILSDFCWFQTDGREPVGQVKVSNKRLESGKDLLFSAEEELEFGALVIEMDVQGKADIIVNGEREYGIDNATEDKFVTGFRFSGIRPSVRIIASDPGCTIRKASVRFYKI